ncbi:MAG: nuclear transport factor 2 family protein [Streptomycetaceae bacterium]|nr:nuclear transport factor 2 family protein [Streptomycetaceae bacterium]
MSPTADGGEALPPALVELLAKDRIREVLCRYSRGVDRKDFELVRSCYHPDATDNHGEYDGGVDGFIEYLRSAVSRYTNTMHFLGNMLIDVQGATAHAETYAIGLHRLPPRPGKLNRDISLMLRYVDVLEERAGEWRIRHRVCTYDWARLDSDLDGRELLGEGFVRGRPFPDDPIHTLSAR